MRGSRLYLLLAAVLIGLPLLGYVWPQSARLTGPVVERDWQWPSTQNQKEIEPQPELLVRFWPSQTSDASKLTDEERSEQTKANQQQTMKLVAIIKQGSQQQALVLNPDGELKTVTVGDTLDEERSVIAISANGLRWQQTDNAPDKARAEQGELSLFPKPF